MGNIFRFCLSSSLFGLLFILGEGQALAQSPSSQEMSKMYGSVGVTTNFVDRGLTQSNKGPSIQAGMGYGFGTHGRIGFEAASVNYPGESANVEMRLLGEFKFVFTANSELKVRNDWIRFFPDARRNRVMIGLDQNFFGYHVLISREDNFEGTQSPRNWFAFHKDWPFAMSFQFNSTVGYSMVQNYDAYFDTRFGLSYLFSNVTVSAAHTWTSKPDQFAGRGDMFFIFTLQARF